MLFAESKTQQAFGRMGSKILPRSPVLQNEQEASNASIPAV